jgi:hypothetical protein
LAVDFGSTHGEGALHFSAGTPIGFAVELSLSQLDVDRWLAAAKPLPPHGLFALPPLSAAALVLPDEVEASLDLRIGALVWRHGLIRDARLAAKLAGGRLTLDHLAAALPGGSELSINGSGTLAVEGLRAEGAAEANTDDLRGLMAWLGIATHNVPGDRLRNASMTGRLHLAGDRLDLGDIDGTLDATRFSAAAVVVLRARPGIGLRLVADRVNLDAYLPQSAIAPGSASATSTEAGVPRGPVTGFDANLDARVAALTWHGQALSDAHFAGILQNGAMTIRELSIGDFAGAAVQLSGVIDEWSGAAPKGQIAFDLRGPAFERVLRLVFPAIGRDIVYGAFRLAGGLKSEGQSFALDTELGLFEGRTHIAGTIAPASEEAEFELDADYPSLADVLGHVSPGYRPAGDLGSLTLGARVAGGLSRFTIDHVALAVGQSTLRGSVVVDLGGVRPLLAADLEIGDWALDRWLPQRQSARRNEGLRQAGLPAGIFLAAEGTAAARDETGGWSRAAFDLDALSLADVNLSLTGQALSYSRWRIDQPTLTAVLRDGGLTVKQLHGSIFGGALEASGALQAVMTPALGAKLVLKGADLKQALGAGAVIDGHFDLDATIAGEGRSPAEIVGSLAGEATLHGRDGSIAGVDLAAVSNRLRTPDGGGDLLALLRSGAHGRTAFSALDGSFQITDGIALSDDIHLSAEAGEGRASASFDLPRWTMASQIEFHPTGIAAPPPLVLRLDGPIDAPLVVLDVNTLQHFLTQRSPGKALSPHPSDKSADPLNDTAMPPR